MKITHGNNTLRSLNHFFTVIVVLSTLSLAHSLQAQIVPDTTLSTNSRVIRLGNTLIINEGTQAGNNLFHSFSEFSLPTGTEAYFNNAATVENIISRVTGNNVSNIDGLIRANGRANLFLLNPNGILFGPNASLNIGGSFLASTANSIQFADGSEFRATNPSTSPLLTISMPIGLQFRENLGSIRVQGTGHSLTLSEPPFPSIIRENSKTKLQVKPGNTLALVGGNIDLQGGTLIAENGQIELGSVNSGRVSLHPTATGWTFGYEGVESFRDIRFSQNALADASGVNSGSIQIQGAKVSLSNGSVILLENKGSQVGGNINIKASQSLEIAETRQETSSELSGIFTQAIGQGKGGDITISTQQLTMQGGVNIDTLTLKGEAQGGNINIDASHSIQLIGVNDSIIARTQDSGDAGNIFVSTGKLTILKGSNILSASNTGKGSAGNVKVNAVEIELIGVEPTPRALPSLISSPTRDGKAGNVEINTSRLFLRDGGQVSSSTLSTGDAGNVTINASEFVDISGTVLGSLNPTQIISSANIVDKQLQMAFKLPPIPTGDSGTVTINTPRLVVTDQAQVTVRNDGKGRAGNLLINADSIFLDTQGGITASTVSGKGGNITLNVRDILQLRNNSQITATSKGIGDGGRIMINTRFLLGAENSDITANSFGGRGGTIHIVAQGIIGFSVQDNRLTSGNDITAFSQKNAELNGIVELNIPEIDPSEGLLVIPETIIDPTALVAQNPCKQGKASGLTITGRGGLPPRINEDLSSGAVQVGLVEPVPTQNRQTEQTKSFTPTTSTTPEPVQGWIFNEKGEVLLTAYNPTVTESQRLPSKSSCSNP